MDLRDALEQLADDVAELYHHAERESDLPHEGAVYGKRADGKNWHCPYRPVEVAEFLRSKIDDLSITFGSEATE